MNLLDEYSILVLSGSYYRNLYRDDMKKRTADCNIDIYDIDILINAWIIEEKRNYTMIHKSYIAASWILSADDVYGVLV